MTKTVTISVYLKVDCGDEGGAEDAANAFMRASTESLHEGGLECEGIVENIMWNIEDVVEDK
jgi:hypothetical protein